MTTARGWQPSKPHGVDEVVRAVRRARDEGESLALAGGRHAMGGQQFPIDATSARLACHRRRMITELFVPRARLAQFMREVREDFLSNPVDLICGTIRRDWYRHHVSLLSGELCCL